MSISLAVAALIGAITSGIAAAGANVWSSYNAKEAQEQANQSNIDLTNAANASQLQQVRETNEFNAAEAQKARDWNEYMSNTQVQRAMADYQAAGLNPLLGATSGATYSSPASAQGAVSQVQRAQVSPAYLDFSGMASAFSSMSNAMLVNAMLGRNADIRANQSALNRSSREAIAAANRASSLKHVTYRNANGIVTGIKHYNYDY